MLVNARPVLLLRGLRVDSDEDRGRQRGAEGMGDPVLVLDGYDAVHVADLLDDQLTPGDEPALS